MLDTSNYLSYLDIYLGIRTKRLLKKVRTDNSQTSFSFLNGLFFCRHGRKAARNRLPRYCIST